MLATGPVDSLPKIQETTQCSGLMHIDLLWDLQRIAPREPGGVSSNGAREHGRQRTIVFSECIAI
eukprot:4344288-Pyramimonas_sp.AAC.1